VDAVDAIDIPKALYCGSKCIVLEYVENTTSYSLLEGCPTNRLCLVLSSLARIHAHFWNRPTTGLSSTAGIGTAMSGIQKERTFPTLWKDFVSGIEMETAQRQRLNHVCTDLSNRRLRDVHERVHEHQRTLIHGDFHVGNLLFDNENNNKLTILDWATCGAGNNMIDVVFFFLISTKLSMTQVKKEWLPMYHRVLLESNGTIEYSWEKCVYDFQTCLLNQFLILVCYDEISKTLLRSEVDSREVLEHYTQHFTNVNKRCVEALLSTEMNLSEYPLPPIKKESDMETNADTTMSDDVIRQL